MAQAQNNSQSLKGKKIAILATDGFEQSELLEPREALKKAGAQVFIVSPNEGFIRGWNHNDWGQRVEVDVELSSTTAADFDALLIPGGVMSPDRLRMIADAVQFVRAFAEAGKPIAAICHGPWMLVEADVVRGRKVTSYRSIRTDLANAGAKWMDEEVVTDGGMVTGRQPSDLPAFIAKMLEEFAEGVHKPKVGSKKKGTKARQAELQKT